MLQHDIVYLYFLSPLTCLQSNTTVYREPLLCRALLFLTQIAGNVLRRLARFMLCSLCRSILHAKNEERRLHSSIIKVSDQHIYQMRHPRDDHLYNLLFIPAIVPFLPATARSTSSPSFSNLSKIPNESFVLSCYLIIFYMSTCSLHIFPHSNYTS